jgi:hypothetical protein
LIEQLGGRQRALDAGATSFAGRATPRRWWSDPRVLTSDGEVIVGAYRRDDLPAAGRSRHHGFRTASMRRVAVAHLTLGS